MNRMFLLPTLMTLLSQSASAQPAGPQAVPLVNAPAAKESASQAAAPTSLVVLFRSGSSVLRPEDNAVLDRAARTYNEGKPFVMILTGNTDRVGAAMRNLTLSQQRAAAVLEGLLARGIPADHFQVLAKGKTEPPVPTQDGVADVRNRSVEITWR